MAKNSKSAVTETMETITESKVKVNAYKLNLRKEPNLESEILRVLEENEELINIESVNDEWIKVKASKPVCNGYVMKEFTSEI